MKPSVPNDAQSLSDSITMRRGRRAILGVTKPRGKVYKGPPRRQLWMGQARPFALSVGERNAGRACTPRGCDQIEIAVEFCLLPTAKFRPPGLILSGPARRGGVKLSRDATNRLSRGEMAASAAPLHSYYLNYVSLDRYRKLGIIFLFNSSTKQFHYDGACWREIVAKFPSLPETAEAQKRLEALKAKMEKTPAKQ